eukprot:COSAG01_NODE_10277_length_2202_cov_4.095578_4_plen_102_part_00
MGRDTLAADLEASKKLLVDATVKTEQQRHRAEYYAGNLKQTRTLLSVTATKLTATDKLGGRRAAVKLLGRWKVAALARVNRLRVLGVVGLVRAGRARHSNS